jgi:hypothetical protein
MTALQKPPKHNPHKTGAGGHEGTRRKNFHIQTFVYEVSFVFKNLFAVESFMQGAVESVIYLLRDGQLSIL